MGLSEDRAYHHILTPVNMSAFMNDHGVMTKTTQRIHWVGIPIWYTPLRPPLQHHCLPVISLPYPNQGKPLFIQHKEHIVPCDHHIPIIKQPNAFRVISQSMNQNLTVIIDWTWLNHDYYIRSDMVSSPLSNDHLIHILYGLILS